jgi:hypothetical protein
MCLKILINQPAISLTMVTITSYRLIVLASAFDYYNLHFSLPGCGSCTVPCTEQAYVSHLHPSPLLPFLRIFHKWTTRSLLSPLKRWIKIHLQLSDDTVWKRGAICESTQNCYGARRTKSTFILPQPSTGRLLFTKFRKRKGLVLTKYLTQTHDLFVAHHCHLKYRQQCRVVVLWELTSGRRLSTTLV